MDFSSVNGPRRTQLYFKSAQAENVVPEFFTFKYYVKAKFLRTKIAKQAFYVSCGIPARKQQQGIGSVGAKLDFRIPWYIPK